MTSRVATKRRDLEHAMKLIETTAVDAGDRDNSVFLYVCYDIACNLDMIKMAVRKFYYLLDKRKGM